MTETKDLTCAGCEHLKLCSLGRTHPGCYCERSGLTLSGTLERQDKCVEEGWKKGGWRQGDVRYQEGGIVINGRKYNPRWVAWCRATGEPLESDEEPVAGQLSRAMRFTTWNHEQWAEYDRLYDPEKIDGYHAMEEDHKRYDQWLLSRFPS